MATMMLARAAIAQTPCTATPVFADDPAPVDTGYFASDIGIDGDGNLAIIGEIFGDENPDRAGTARILMVQSGSWQEVETLQLEDPHSNDWFGASVDVSGRFAIIAVPPWDVNPAQNDNTGAAFIFDRDVTAPVGSEWAEFQRLDNPGSVGDGFAGSRTRHETVAIDGSLAVVGASNATVDGQTGAGVAHVFVHNLVANQWTHEDTIELDNPQPGEQFGYGVHISGNRIILGAPYYDEEIEDIGRAFVFKRVAGTGSTYTWELEGELRPANPAEDDQFGWSVSIDGNSAVVGAPQSPPLGSGAGYATVFGFSVATETWTEYATLLASDGIAGDGFGVSVAISASMALVGASFRDAEEVNFVGGAYLFQRNISGWTQALFFLPDVIVAADEGARVGETLALQGDEAFVGVPSDEDDEQFPGWLQLGSVLIYSDVPPCP